MTSTTISSRKFNQDASGAKKAARHGPVFITDRGQPAHVLLSIEDYRKLAGKQPSIVKLLAQRGGGAIQFEPPHLRERLQRDTKF